MMIRMSVKGKGKPSTGQNSETTVSLIPNGNGVGNTAANDAYNPDDDASPEDMEVIPTKDGEVRLR